MKALINKFRNYLYFKKEEILRRKPHISDILVGMFLFWALATLFSSCAVPIPLMLPVVDAPVVIPETTLI